MNKLAIYTISISPHITSYWRILNSFWDDKVYYYYKTNKHDAERVKIGWTNEDVKNSFLVDDSNYEALEKVDVLIETMRDISLMERRVKQKLFTFYSSERWFKPPVGFLRLLIPSFFRMAFRFVKIFSSPYFYLMPQGIHAARDMVRLVGFMRGSFSCLFRAPKVAFESRPGGVIVPLSEAIHKGVLNREEILFCKKYGFVQIPKEHWGKVKPQDIFAKMHLWGYFVEPSKIDRSSVTEKSDPKVLWVGRMLNLKRVKDLVKACGYKIHLSIYGNGPTENSLKVLAKNRSNIIFHGFVPASEVRAVMRDNDVYVLSSNGYEGWGAVVSEALEEGMKIIGTVDAGATATILPLTHLYKAGDVRNLERLLSSSIEYVPKEEWSAESAAKALKAIIEGITRKGRE